MKRFFLASLLAFAAAFAFAPAFAQVGGAVQAITPLTRDLGKLVTLTAAGAGTTNSADQSGYNVSRIVCVFNQSAHTGTPSTTFTVQGKDAASGLYYTLLTSAAITADATPTAVHVGAGIASAANTGAGVMIPRFWRVSTTVGGTTPGVTATIDCVAQ